MRELGRRGGKGRGGIKPGRVHEGLRAYLRREVSPAEVWAALKLAMEGQNESARVAASRVLVDALHEPERETPRDDPAATEAARERVLAIVQHGVVGVLRALLTTGEPAKGDAGIVRLSLESIQQDERLGPIAECLAGLRTFEERAEQMAQERLAALREEHGIPA